MKKIVLFLLCSINLLAYKVENVNNREVIIYPNKVIVNESLKLKNNGDKDKIIYEGIPKYIDIGSVNLVGGDLKKVEIEKGVDSNSILEYYVGKTIHAEKNGKTYELLLIDYRKNIVGKDMKTGEIYILNNPDLKLSDPNIKTKNKLIMDIGKIDKKVKLSYITRGINLNISHRLNTDKMELETWANLYNNTGKDLEGTKVKIISEIITPRAYMMKSQMADNISVVESNERIEYILKDKLNLKKINEKNIKLGDSKVELENKYVYWTKENSKNPTRVIEIRNRSDSTIPMGKIYVQDNKNFIGDSNLGFIPKGEKYNLRLNKNFNVVVDKKIKKSYPLGNNLIRKEIEIEIKNNSKQKLSLEINYDQLPEVWTELRSKEKYDKISNKIIRFKLDIYKNSKKKIIFSYIEKKNKLFIGLLRQSSIGE